MIEGSKMDRDAAGLVRTFGGRSAAGTGVGVSSGTVGVVVMI